MDDSLGSHFGEVYVFWPTCLFFMKIYKNYNDGIFRIRFNLYASYKWTCHFATDDDDDWLIDFFETIWLQLSCAAAVEFELLTSNWMTQQEFNKRPIGPSCPSMTKLAVKWMLVECISCFKLKPKKNCRALMSHSPTSFWGCFFNSDTFQIHIMKPFLEILKSTKVKSTLYSL